MGALFHNAPSPRVSLLVTLATLALPAVAQSATFTLSDAALMLLDYDNRDHYVPPLRGEVIARRDVPGPGVEFDIHYPSNTGRESVLQWVSCVFGGAGSLTGIDITAYDAFALEFNLLSVNGQSGAGVAGPFIVGAMINRSYTRFAFQPQVIGFYPYYTSAISETTTDDATIKTVGFTAYIPYWWYDDPADNPWDPAGSVVTLLVAPPPGATQIPDPATFLLLAAGACFGIRPSRRARRRSSPTVKR